MITHPLTNYIITEKDVPGRTLLIKEGSPSDHIFVLLKGRVKVKKKTEKGEITLETLKEGAIIGEMTLFETTPGARSASVVTEGPARIGIINKTKVDQEISQMSPECLELFKSLFISLQKENERASLVAQTLMG